MTVTNASAFFETKDFDDLRARMPETPRWSGPVTPGGCSSLREADADQYKH
jgi:hypothetical protein